MYVSLLDASFITYAQKKKRFYFKRFEIMIEYLYLIKMRYNLHIYIYIYFFHSRKEII